MAKWSQLEPLADVTNLIPIILVLLPTTRFVSGSSSLITESRPSFAPEEDVELG
jgi:hypothetical protein